MPRWLYLIVFLSACAPITETARELQSKSALPANTQEQLRVVSWNVSRDSFFEHQQRYARVLALIDADILILDEMPTDVSAEAIAAALHQIDDDGRPWNVIYGSSGGRERSSIASRLPLRRLAPFDQTLFRAEPASQWLDATRSANERARLQRSLRSGVTLAGAVARWAGREILIVGVDFECCGDGGNSWEESKRRYEARQLRSLIDGQPAALAAAAIVGGDFNAVNGPAPLMIVQGAAESSGHLRIAPARQLDGIDRWTWDGRGTPFASGQLDYQMYGSRWRVARALVLDLDDLSETERRQSGLEFDLNELTRHRPVVVDYRWVD